MVMVLRHLHDRHPFHYHPGFKLVGSDLEDYQSIQRVDDEGKYLFDFMTASVWNARKLTILGARTPTGKWLVVEVGEEPMKNVQKNG